MQPVLFTAIGNGFLVYCGLITAAAAALLGAVDKILPPDGLRLLLGLAASAALGAGVLALFVMAATHNHARRAERTDTTEDEVNSARRWTIGFATATMVVTIVSTTLLVAALAMFVTARPAPPVSIVHPIRVVLADPHSPATSCPVAPPQPAPAPFCK